MEPVIAFLPEHADEIHISSTLHFAIEEAKKSKNRLTVYVNVKNSCPFLEGVFDHADLSRLHRNQSIVISGVEITLESTATLAPFTAHDVILAVHASTALCAGIDRIKERGSFILVADKADVPDEWINSHQVRLLKAE
jgi:hypothetical protein